ncbi:MAG: AMP-binding protein [Gallionellaceae bacterium]|nr:AMP-binding protein [Gallionellaceae bacterium]
MNGAPLFAALAAREDAAVVLRGDSASWSAAALLDEVAALSTRLADCRVLAVLADNSPEWVIADLAALRAGRVHLPLPAFFTQAQLAHALDQTGADMLLTDQPGRVENLNLGFATVSTWRGLAWMRRVCARVDLPAGTAKVSFTSGSTGSPKGVCLSEAGLLQTATALVETLADLPLARHLAVLPLALLLENVAGVYAPLLRGAKIVLPGLAQMGWRGMAGFDAVALRGVIERVRPHSLILVPELLKALLALGQGDSLTPNPSPGGGGEHREPLRDFHDNGLCFVAVGGARCDAALITRARQLGLPVYEGYGLTECGSVVSLNHPGADKVGTVGQALPHVRVKVDATREVRINIPAFLGYLGDDGKSNASGFSTGDLGHLDHAGFLHLSGRRKNLLVTAFGRNVAPEWVEAALTAQPEIAQAVVFGDARPWLVAVLVAMPGVDATALAHAVARANAGLPDYARVGDWIDAAPFTPGNAQATGNGRPVRAAIATCHGDAIAALYRNKELSHVVL